MRLAVALLALLALGLRAHAQGATYDDPYDAYGAYYEDEEYGYDTYDRFGYYDEYGYDGLDSYGDEGAFGYDMDYLGYDDMYYDDFYSYYGDEYAEYYGYYGYYGDEYGADYNWEYDEFVVEDCTTDGKKATITGDVPVCDLKVSGADKVAVNLEGGIDGKYKMTGCHNGRPLYSRKGNDAAPRVLWFSLMFGDWDISPALEPEEDNIIVYGGSGLEEERPNFVEKDSWAVAAYLASESQTTLQDYVALPLKIECADGSTLKSPDVDVFGRQPLLTSDELEQKYAYIYEQYRRKEDAPPTISFTSVIMVVAVGAFVLLGVPYVIFKKRPESGGKSFAQMLEHSRKKRTGHTL